MKRLTPPYTPATPYPPPCQGMKRLTHPYTPLTRYPPPCQVMKQVVAWKKLNTEPDAMMRFKQLNNMPL